ARTSGSNSVTVSTTVTSNSGDTVIDAAAGLKTTGGGISGAPGTGQTIRWTGALGLLVGGGSTKPGDAGSTTMSWTFSIPGSANAAISALSLIPTHQADLGVT